MPRHIRTECSIAATPQEVWDVLTDFEAYPAWAPFFASITGEARAGTRLVVKFKKGPTVKPVVTTAETPRELEWQGKLLFGGLFDARHRFELQTGAGGTKFIHSEQFSGLLVPLFGRLLRDTEREFEAFNEALKTRCEGEERTITANEPA
jgi:hypothetical protein